MPRRGHARRSQESRPRLISRALGPSVAVAAPDSVWRVDGCEGARWKALRQSRPPINVPATLADVKLVLVSNPTPG
jgi:hypothetical protein